MVVGTAQQPFASMHRVLANSLCLRTIARPPQYEQQTSRFDATAIIVTCVRVSLLSTLSNSLCSLPHHAAPFPQGILPAKADITSILAAGATQNSTVADLKVEQGGAHSISAHAAHHGPGQQHQQQRSGSAGGADGTLRGPCTDVQAGDRTLTIHIGEQRLWCPVGCECWHWRGRW